MYFINVIHAMLIVKHAKIQDLKIVFLVNLTLVFLTLKITNALQDVQTLTTLKMRMLKPARNATFLA